jgi:serine-type D-Ala-D-Ala carboxypeptidase/endopeptidase (penicillin-binding protein 4)
MLVPATAGSAAPGDIEGQLRASLRSPGVASGQTGAIAIDLSSGEVLFSHHADRALVPASNAKLAVTLTALVRLGSDFRIRTEVLGVGERRGPAWAGDLVLKGYGDPTFDAAQLKRLAGTLKARGIRSVTGRILGDESFFDNRRDVAGWKPSFVGDESPPLSALVLDRGAGWPSGSPPLLAARALRSILTGSGITVGGPAGAGVTPSDATPLGAVESPPLSDLVKMANSESDNFVAEMLLKQIGAISKEVGTSASGAAGVRETLASLGVPLRGVRIVDGSGLSRLDRITPRALVAILRAGVLTRGVGPAFRRSLAVAGRSGTLHKRLYGLEGALRGKTGTTDLSCSLTAMISSRIAFSVLANGRPVNYWAARAAQDRFALLLTDAF